MNFIRKSYLGILFSIIVSALAMLGFTSCQDDSTDNVADYGYAQFLLVKSDSYDGTRATIDRLDFLSEASKVKVVMQYNGSTINQTLVLHSYNNENAEYGVKSDKLELLKGTYTIIGYEIYDKLDQVILTGELDDNKSFEVVKGGLTVHTMPVKVTGRGMAEFKLVKEFLDTRAGSAYPFSNIKAIDITVKNEFSKELTEIKKVVVKHKTGYNDASADETLYPGANSMTDWAVCDTTVWLKAGTYTISSYVTYSDKKASYMLEATTLPAGKGRFVVSDNKLSEEVEVPIQLSQTAEYIKDYIALREIWEALDGPNWSYVGESEAVGCNWYFNKDMDLWGDQPGVGIDNNGRVTSLSLAGFGISGVVPDAIGQLTELRVLSLGTHDEKLGGKLFADAKKGTLSAEQLQQIRMDYDQKFLARDIREDMSDILRDGINSDSNQKPIKMSNRIQKKDVMFGSLTNGVVGISRALLRLNNLQQFYIANSPITEDKFFRNIEPSSPFYAGSDTLKWANMKALTDVELYNLPKLNKLPMEMLAGLPEIQLLNIACNQNISGEQLRQDWVSIIHGNSGRKIQILYMGYNNLVEFPESSDLKQMTKLSMLDCTNNKVEVVHPFGKDIQMAKMYLDNNKIKEIPADADGYFFGYYDVESFTCSYNQLTELPNIFNAKSNYVIESVDFSHNNISGFADGENHRGVNVTQLNLSYNKFTTFPSLLFKKGSPIAYLMLSSNGLTEIPEGSLKGDYAHYLTSMDLTYNKLKKLPSDFWPITLPYLYGLDISYNSFDAFPYEPLNCKGLTIMGIRCQRDENGNRCLKEWPTGLYKCPSLAAFYIGSNDLRKIDDTISPYIRVFEIKDNPNISIELSSTVCSYIQLGYYTLVYDSTQDIRGCSALNLD